MGRGHLWTKDDTDLLNEWVTSTPLCLRPEAKFSEYRDELMQLFPARSYNGLEAKFYKVKQNLRKKDQEERNALGEVFDAFLGREPKPTPEAPRASPLPESVFSITRELDAVVEREIARRVAKWVEEANVLDKKVDALEDKLLKKEAENAELKELLRKLAAVRQSVEEFQEKFKNGGKPI